MRKSKILFLVLALVMALAVVVACGTPEAVVEEPLAVELPEDGEEVPVEEKLGCVCDDCEEEPIVVELVPFPRPAGLVYSFETDVHFQSAEVGTRGSYEVLGGTAYFLQAGNPTWNIIEGPGGGNAIRISDRANDWDSMDIAIAEFDMDLENNDYLLTVRGYLPNGGIMWLRCADTFEIFSEYEVEGSGPYVITLVLDAELVDSLGSRKWIRAQESGLENFEIHDITVMLYIPRAEGVVYQLSADPFVQALEVGVRDADGDATVLATPHFAQAGNPTWTIVEGPYGNAIQNTNREANWNALDVVSPHFDWDIANNTYLLTVTGYLTGGGTAVIGGADAPWAHLVELDTDGDFVISLEIDEEMLAAAGTREWFRIMSACMKDMIIYEITVVRQ